ncbi:zinc finger MYM-type protein 1-like [Cynara cardunculus var. scolymus]|uniref:zinc finger MYM-type protein 1-like n=1 Tax=Cynara cardunculus var. scolymus TaxID=59895 RepID=UPI000D62AD66|nr:zinc finger MYM-type protein 1-like [Cynara cardunculus var. scolymus]
MEISFKRKASTPESNSAPSMPYKIDLYDLPWDPADRNKVLECHPNQRDEIKRKSLIKGPCQPRGQCGSDTFVTDGCNSWNKTKRLGLHVDDINSFHNRALKKNEDLMSQDRSITVAFHKQTEKEKNEHRIRLNALIKFCRFLLKNALPFPGYDESEMSISKGTFLETLALIGNFNEDVVDESSDVYKNEQMVVVLRYVDAHGIVKERFFGIVHVTETSSSILKYAIDTLFVEHGLSLKQVRGQGYDGASNMCGEFNGLKALILNENSSGYYIHSFVRQRQLVIVAVANKHDEVENFFNMLGMVINVANASCKRKDMLRQSYKDRVQEAIGKCEIEIGTGKYQELSLIRAGDTRWGSRYKTILSLIALFPDVVEVLQYVEEDGIMVLVALKQLNNGRRKRGVTKKDMEVSGRSAKDMEADSEGASDVS